MIIKVYLTDAIQTDRQIDRQTILDDTCTYVHVHTPNVHTHTPKQVHREQLTSPNTHNDQLDPL